MKVAIFSSSFHPDHTGISVYSTDLALFLEEQGHQVTVLTSFPHYPAWKKRASDNGVILRFEDYHGVRVLRTYIYVPKVQSSGQRIAYDVSFVASAAAGSLFLRKQDAVIAFAPPLLLGVVGWMCALRWRSQLVVEVQDLQLDAALALRMLRDGFAARLLRRIERHVFDRADWIATLSEGMQRAIVAKGVLPDKIEIVPNWIDVASASVPVRKGRFRRRFPNIGHGALVGYAGNMGVKQGLRTVVEAAEIMAARSVPVEFVLAGDGAARQEVEDLVLSKKLSNVHVIPTQSPSEYRELLADLDVFLLPQVAGVGEVFFPSKLLGIVAAGCPMIIAADDDCALAEAGRASGSAVVVRAADPAAVADAIVDLIGDARLRRALSAAGGEFLVGFDRERVLRKFEERLVSQGRAARQC